MKLYTSMSFHEVYTFDELVEYGKKQGVPLMGDAQMPWSFKLDGVAVTHENDDCYIVGSTHFKRGEMLVKSGDSFTVWPMVAFTEVFQKA